MFLPTPSHSHRLNPSSSIIFSFRSLLRPSHIHLNHLPIVISRFINHLPSHSDLTEPLNDDVYPLDSDARRSDASQYGSTRIPIVHLPPDLVSGVQELLQSVPHRSTIRTSALGLYAKYRITSSTESLTQSNDHLINSFLSDPDTQLEKKIIKPKLSTNYDHLTSISFAAGAMPSNYGATLKVFLDLKRRLNSVQVRHGLETPWSPKSLLDYGSGTGSAIWSALQVWPDGIKHYTALDKSRSMIWLNQKLLENCSHVNSTHSKTSSLMTTFKTITISPTESQKLEHQVSHDFLMDRVTTLESNQSTDLMIDLELPKQDWIQDSDGLLAIMSFTLSDLPNQAARRQAIEGMWNSGAEIMVIIDRGTPAGFQVVAEARQQLLMLGRRKIRNSNLTTLSSNQATANSATLTSQVAQSTSVQVEKQPLDSPPIELSNQTNQLGSWVLAPCPHDKPCPLHLSDNPKHFCHFSQRIERPQFLKLTKHTSKQEEDAKYSYVIIKRGNRPPSPLPSPVGAPLNASTDLSNPSLQRNDGKIQHFSKGDALDWPRIILPPHKCKGHVIFDVCTTSGQIERITIPRSQGKQAYYDARKTFWGDLWPHGSKKPGLIKTLKGRNLNRGDRRRKKKEMNSLE